MRFSDSFLDEIRARLPVSQVVSRKVPLKRAGREFKGLSPFKHEKTPSFTVNDRKGFYHCFASGEHGDIFTFLTKTEGLSFPEAVERLAQEAGLSLPKQDPAVEARLKKQLSLFDAMEAAVDFFVDTLRGPNGILARSYLERRGLTSETTHEFRFGYAPADRNALKTELTRKGFSETQLVACGLLVQPENGGLAYDRFRDRVIIPIHDQRGRVIAFGGRAIRADVVPKYLNSPETELFHKGAAVFNFHRARQPAFEKDEVVVVEGYLDAIAVYQAGIKNVVATMGTAFTEEQIQLLWRLASEPAVCFDGDRAGEEAAFRAIDRILPGLEIGQSFRFAFLSGAKDPDDLIRESGVAAFQAVLKTSIPFHEAMWRRELKSAQIETPEGKAALERRLYRLTETIKDAAVRRHYMTSLKIRLSKYFWDHARNSKRSNSRSPNLALETAPTVERVILGMAVEYPELFEDHWEQLRDLKMTDAHAAFRNALIQVILASEDRLVATIYEKLDRRYYLVLNEVHGDEIPTQNQQRGHKLFWRCPDLKLNPDPGFIEDYFLLHVAELELRAEEDELQSYATEYAVNPTPENERLLLELKRSVDRRRAQAADRERDIVARIDEARATSARKQAA